MDSAIMTAGEKLIEQGRQETLWKLRVMVEKLLLQRFGALPTQLAAQLHSGDDVSLQRWSERIFETPTVNAVFNGLS